MARAALPGRLTWQLGRVLELRDETSRCRSVVLELPDWPGHRAGQHVDVRLTAEDGYQAQRSYSIASPPEDRSLMLTIERLEGGEVSPYLVDDLRTGDELELRGPIGGYFVWQQSLGGPLLLVAGGSGVVPLRAMLRHWAASEAGMASRSPARLLYSARSLPEVIYRDELSHLAADHGAGVHLALRESGQRAGAGTEGVSIATSSSRSPGRWKSTRWSTSAVPVPSWRTRRRGWSSWGTDLVGFEQSASDPQQCNDER